MKNKVIIDFECNEDWDTMTPTDKGRFCTLCSKEVIDFTDLSSSQFNKMRETEGELCGRFDIKQVDTTILRPVETPKKLKFIAFLSSFFVVVSANVAYGEESRGQKVEQVVSDNSKSSLNTNEEMKMASDVHLNSTVAEIPIHHDEIVKPKKPKYKKNHRKYYWSRRFPFIKKRKQRTMGVVRRL